MHSVRLLSTAAGLGAIALAVLLVRSIAPQDSRRALLAAGLLLFLPAHIYMSAMLNEEILASAFTSLAVTGAALASVRPASANRALLRACGLGLAAGLALLTKLTGLLAAVSVSAAYAAGGWRQGNRSGALLRAALVLLVALMAGGWYYARNRVEYGYFYPKNLPTHTVMQTMPPGTRSVGDYLRVPHETWTDPQLLSPALLRSVWGSTYVTVWFDGHRTYLPRDARSVRWMGSLLTLLGLLPTAAFAVGLVRGARRALRTPAGPDTPLLLLVGLTLAGYTLFTWQNPWFAALKGTYLLGLSVPFAFYASEVLASWTRPGRASAPFTWAVLGVLALAVVLTFTYGPVFAKSGEFPGLFWSLQ